MAGLKVAPIQQELVENMVVVTGAPRSGTTLLGKILGSLEGLEYHFEPPTFYMICSLYASGNLPLAQATSLLRVFCAEDLFLDTVHGRTVNLRPHDDSLVLNRMTWPELNERWEQIRNRADALAWVAHRGNRCAVKMPNVMDAMPLLEQVMPKGHLVLLARDGRDVVRSIIRKGWVSDEGLASDLWPYRACDNVPLPYWVPERFADRWHDMNEATRACIMWTTHAGIAREVAGRPGVFAEERFTLVRYENLLHDADREADRLAEGLGAVRTAFTRRWVESVRPPASSKERSGVDFEASVERDVLEWFQGVNADWGY